MATDEELNLATRIVRQQLVKRQQQDGTEMLQPWRAPVFGL